MLSVRSTAQHIDAPYQYTKTPARNIHKTRTENSVPHGGRTGKVHSRKQAAQTPSHPKTPRTPHTLSKPGALATRTVSRPLLDKTPFQNRKRNSPASHTPLISKLAFYGDNVNAADGLKVHPETLLRPSSTRKHIRVPRSASKSFETPPNKGNHWDVSDIEICLPATPATVEEECAEDYEEIEYMPPRPSEIPYSPPFDYEHPDYKELGKTLLGLVHPYPVNDTPPQLDGLCGDPFFAESSLLLPELDDDDPFEQASKSSMRVTTTLKRPTPVTATASMKSTKRAPSNHSMTTRSSKSPLIGAPASRSVAEKGTRSTPALNKESSRPPLAMSRTSRLNSTRRPAASNARTTPGNIRGSTNRSAITDAKTAQGRGVIVRTSRTVPITLKEAEVGSRKGMSSRSTPNVARRSQLVVDTVTTRSKVTSSSIGTQGGHPGRPDVVLSFDGADGTAMVGEDFRFDV